MSVLDHIQQHIKDHVAAHVQGSAADPPAEYIQNGGFNGVGAPWDVGTDWSVVAGQYAQCSGSGATLAAQLHQALDSVILIGTECTLSFVVVDNNADSAGMTVRLTFGGAFGQTVYNDAGVASIGLNTITFTASSGFDGIAFRGYTGAFSIKITDVSLTA